MNTLTLDLPEAEAPAETKEQKEHEEFLASLEHDYTILHPHGMVAPYDDANGDGFDPAMKAANRIQRSASSAAPWNEEELDKRSTCEVTTGNVDGRGDDMKKMTEEEMDAFIKSVPVHKEVAHPEGVDISGTEANLGWGTQYIAEGEDRLERSASPVAPWSEEELDERSTLGPDDAPAAAGAATTDLRKINTTQME